jgi:hypothetical protein
MGGEQQRGRFREPAYRIDEMMIPGRVLQRLASRFCSDRTRALIMESLVADFQHEWSHASAGKRGVILVKGYAAFWVAFLLCGLRGLTALDMATEDRRAVGRALAWALVLGTGAMGALMVLPLLQLPVRVPLTFKGSYLAHLIPQALPLAIPVGLTLGIVLGFARPVSRTTTKVILAIAMACSIVSLVTMAWIMPVANQVFRTETARRLGYSVSPVRGHSELTVGELKQELAVAVAAGEIPRARRASATLHERRAIAVATLLLAALAVALRNRYRTAGRIKLVAVTCAAFPLWIVLLSVGHEILLHGAPVFAGIWLPNLTLGIGLVFLVRTTPLTPRVETLP